MVERWITESKHQVFPPRKFVGLPSDMDGVVARYKRSGGDWRIINDELNLGADSLEGERLYLVRVGSGDPRFRFELPTGNEAGAYKNQWVPGGRTKDGIREAALVGSEKVEHSSSIDKLLGQFEDWEQLQ